MPYLNFLATNLGLCVIDGEAKDCNILLLGGLRLARRETVRLATEEDFEKLEGNLRLTEQDIEAGQDNGRIGTIAYIEAWNGPGGHTKARYMLDIKLAKPRFAALMATLGRGQMPSEITVKIEGMDYDGRPDGSGKVWDNKTNWELPIESVTFTTPLIGPDPTNFLDDRSPEDRMPPSRAQINHVLSTLNDLKYKVESIRSRLIWLIIIVAIIFAALLWRYC